MYRDHYEQCKSEPVHCSGPERDAARALTKVGGAKQNSIARLERALAAEAAAAQNAPAGPSADQQEFYEVLEGLNEVVEELQETVDGYDPPPYSRQALLNLLRENMVKFTPDMRIGILRELKQVHTPPACLHRTSSTPDTWKACGFCSTTRRTQGGRTATVSAGWVRWCSSCPAARPWSVWDK